MDQLYKQHLEGESDSFDQPAALFLDRDGTLIEHIRYLHDPKKVRLFSGVRSALQSAQYAGVRLFLHTNQSGVSRGYFTLEDAIACNDRMFSLLNLEKPFDGTKICTESPAEQPVYRKPSPRYILEMIQLHRLDVERCVMIGDSRSDMEAGMHAKINVIAVRGGAGDSEDPDWPAFLEAHGFPHFHSADTAIRAALERIQ